MLKLTIHGTEQFDEASNEFFTPADVNLELEHSLISLSKWEAIWEKPFLSAEEKTTDETFSYIECMCLTPDVPPETFRRLRGDHLETINKYIEAKMSATWFTDAPAPKGRSREVITAEIMYHWIVAFTLPLDVENWHLNRFFTLVKVCNEKNAPPDKKKKMSPQQIMERNRALNEKRLQELKTKG